MAVPTRLELAISCVTGRCVNQLHHGTLQEIMHHGAVFLSRWKLYYHGIFILTSVFISCIIKEEKLIKKQTLFLFPPIVLGNTKRLEKAENKNKNYF